MRFGILGEAKIAREWLVPAIIESGHEVTHLGRRNPGQESLPGTWYLITAMKRDMCFVTIYCGH